MTSEDVRKIVLRLHDQSVSSRKIMEHLGGEISKTTINRWIKMFKESGEINLKYSLGRKRSKRTKRLITQVKAHLLQGKVKKSTRKLAKVYNVSITTMQRLIKDDLGYKSYIKRIAPKLTDAQKQKRCSFGIWATKNIRKLLSRKILFSDEKRFDLDGLYNRQNGLRVVNKQMLMVEFIEKQSFLKVLWYGSESVMKTLLVQLLLNKVR